MNERTEESMKKARELSQQALRLTEENVRIAESLSQELGNFTQLISVVRKSIRLSVKRDQKISKALFDISLSRKDSTPDLNDPLVKGTIAILKEIIFSDRFFIEGFSKGCFRDKELIGMVDKNDQTLVNITSDKLLKSMNITAKNFGFDYIFTTPKLPYLLEELGIKDKSKNRKDGTARQIRMNGRRTYCWDININKLMSY